MSIKVSVIMPVKFDNPYFEKSLESTFSGMNEMDELILVDDDADEKARELMSEFIQNKSQVRLIKSKGKGIVDALLSALEIAKGEYIARMDADDISINDRLHKQTQYLDDNPEVGLVSCLVKYHGDSTVNEGFARFVDWINTLDTHKKMYHKRYAEAVVAHPTVMFRKDLLTLGTYRKTDDKGQKVPEDFDLWLRWLNQGVKFAKIPEYLLEWSDLPCRLSRVDKAYSKRAFWNSVAENFQIESGKPYWICGYGRPVERRMKGLLNRGLTISGYIGLQDEKRDDGIPVIKLEESICLIGEALILVYVANLEGKTYIQHFFDENGFVEGRDYLWMV